MTSRANTRGLTLLEVVLALAILAGSFAVLAQLVGIAVEAANRGRQLTRAQLLAESVMSEVAAGVLPPESVDGMPLATDPGWIVSATVQSTPHQGLIQVTVITQREEDTRGRSQFLLTRWMRDPRIEIPIEAEDEAQDADGGNASSQGSDPPAGNDSGIADGGGNPTQPNVNPPSPDPRGRPPGDGR